MGDIAILVNNLSKQYRIGRTANGNRTMREALTDAVVSPFRRAGSLLRGQASGAAELDKEFSALRDVSFEVKQGEVIGIIGRNGAGKSTLLKILTRITGPTKGCVEIRGRVASLLEVGTGFHSELTGRENVYLNGAILGMAKQEIVKKFDDIVSFAETGEFIDTPVKHYSSGMYLRLAFAVAAYLEPDILLIDEVLAVGDARFQQKCLSKMQEIGKSSRTVLFVSHNLPAITTLCARAILLDEGRIVEDGPSSLVVSKYLNSGFGTSARHEWPDPLTAPGGDVARLRAVRVLGRDRRIVETVDIQDLLHIEVEYDMLKGRHRPILILNFCDEEGVCAFSARDLDPTWADRPRPEGRYVNTVTIPGNFLSSGVFYLNVRLYVPESLQAPSTEGEFHERSVVAFRVLDSLNPNAARGDYRGSMPGGVRPILQWKTEYSGT